MAGRKCGFSDPEIHRLLLLSGESLSDLDNDDGKLSSSCSDVDVSANDDSDDSQRRFSMIAVVHLCGQRMNSGLASAWRLQEPLNRRYINL